MGTFAAPGQPEAVAELVAFNRTNAATRIDQASRIYGRFAPKAVVENNAIVRCFVSNGSNFAPRSMKALLVRRSAMTVDIAFASAAVQHVDA